MTKFEESVADFHKGMYPRHLFQNQRVSPLSIFRIFEYNHYHYFTNENGESNHLVLYGGLDVLITHVAFLRVNDKTVI